MNDYYKLNFLKKIFDLYFNIIKNKKIISNKILKKLILLRTKKN